MNLCYISFYYLKQILNFNVYNRIFPFHKSFKSFTITTTTTKNLQGRKTSCLMVLESSMIVHLYCLRNFNIMLENFQQIYTAHITDGFILKESRRVWGYNISLKGILAVIFYFSPLVGSCLTWFQMLGGNQNPGPAFMQLVSESRKE